MNLCLEEYFFFLRILLIKIIFVIFSKRDLILGDQGKKLEIKFWRKKFKLKKMKFRKVGR